jgi:class 3 adenylate cyclase
VTTGAVPQAGRSGSPVRVVAWVTFLAVPLLGLWLLIARPHLDSTWEHDLVHFWLVVGVALINVVIAARMNEQTRRRADARLFLVSMAFLASSGFLALHALATPNVLVGRNTGFVIATPVGLFLAAGFAAASSIELSPARAAAVMKRQAWLRIALLVLVLGWGAATVLRWGPLDRPIGPTEAEGPLKALAVAGTVLYTLASASYYRMHRRRPAVMLLSIITAFVLLAEAMVAVAFARNWHVSWWEWHVLMAAAFAFVSFSARQQHGREGTRSGLFNSITLEQNIRAIQHDHGQALEELVTAMRRQEETGHEQPVARLAAQLGERFGLTERQVEVMGRAAEALAGEREQIEQLGALVALGQEASVNRREPELVARAVALADDAFRRDRIRVGLLHEGEVRYVGGREVTAGQGAIPQGADPVQTPDGSGGTTLALALTVKGTAAGVLEAHRPKGGFGPRDVAVFRSLASQLSIALENTRLYRQIEGLFRQYMSPDVAASLLADPEQASLGGTIREVTVLMADLRGFTPFSERSSPDQVVAMLNRYFGIAVPVVLEEGGTVVQFVGDAMMALFNAPTRQPDHALRAARAGLALQERIGAEAAEHPAWPRFRVGINSGPALVGNIGSHEFRNFTAIGDTTNLAARLEATADVGQVIISATTCALLGGAAQVESLGPLHLKGKQAPVEAFVLQELRSPT